jgi:hypothetical protein
MHGGQVNHAIGLRARDGLLQTAAVADVPLDETNARRQVFAAAARQIVVSHDFTAQRTEPLAQRGSDEAGGAGDEHGTGLAIVSVGHTRGLRSSVNTVQ